MLYIYEHQLEAKEKADVAYEWVKPWKDKEIGGKWLQVFRNAESKLKTIREVK